MRKQAKSRETQCRCNRMMVFVVSIVHAVLKACICHHYTKQGRLPLGRAHLPIICLSLLSLKLRHEDTFEYCLLSTKEKKHGLVSMEVAKQHFLNG